MDNGYRESQSAGAEGDRELRGQTAERVLELAAALQKEELELYYQPQLELSGGNIIGVEALLRWNHPREGVLPPDRFVPLAERTGLIVPIGEWVIRTACLQMKVWQQGGNGSNLLAEGMTMAVNLSPLQLEQGDLAEQVERALAASGLDGRYLELEITESAALDVEKSAAALSRLKALGVRISLDDFGTGYSSFACLKRLPADAIKIDLQFIRDCTSSEVDAGIVESLIEMARRLNLGIVAEGVETREQLAYLRRQRCIAAQGYLFGKPMPADELTAILAGLPGRFMRLAGADDGTGTALSRQLDAFVEDNADAVCILDRNRAVTKVNPAFRAMFGWDEEELIGRAPPFDLAAAAIEQQAANKETAGQRKDGTVFEVSISVSAIRDDAGEATAYAAVMRDISARKAAEERMRRTEALATAGEIAAGVAHEIRNPMTAIKGFVQLMRKQAHKDDYYEVIFSEFSRLEAKVNEFLLLARPQLSEYTPTDVAALVTHIVAECGSSHYERRVVISAAIGRRLPLVMGHADHLRRLIIHLINNAVEASREDGTVVIRAERTKERQVKISVIDKGVGMNRELLDRMGFPFYSTKTKGIGLGLTICQKIVDQHGGSLRFVSRVNYGTTVEVLLPAMTKTAKTKLK